MFPTIEVKIMLIEIVNISSNTFMKNIMMIMPNLFCQFTCEKINIMLMIGY